MAMTPINRGVRTSRATKEEGRRLYAVGMKGWVEIRSASSPPRKQVSEVTKPLKYQERRTIWVDTSAWNGHYRDIVRTVTRDLKLSATIFIGGRVKATLKTAAFTRYLRVSVQHGGMMELSPDMIDILTQKGVLK